MNGFALARCFAGMLVIFDAGDLRTLAAASSPAVVAIGLLFSVTGLTSASVRMGFTVMLFGQHDYGGGKIEKPGDSGSGQAVALRVPAHRH